MIFCLVLFLMKLCITVDSFEELSLEDSSEFNADNFTESMQAEVKEKLCKGTPNLLLILGDTLKDSLLHPTPDRNHGQQTLDGLINYFNNLNDVYEMMNIKNKDVEKKLGLKLFRVLIEAGGPPHVNIEFDIEDVMAKFEWNNRAVYNCRKVIDETEAVWEKMQTAAEKLEKEKLQ